MTQDVTPAIVRDYSPADRNVSIISQPKDTVSFKRGLGDSGYKVQVVEYECPAEYCSFDRMVRRIDVNPEFRDEVRYLCLNPNCVHYAADSMSHACHGSYPQRSTDEPAVFEKREA